SLSLCSISLLFKLSSTNNGEIAAKNLRRSVRDILVVILNVRMSLVFRWHRDKVVGYLCVDDRGLRLACRCDTRIRLAIICSISSPAASGVADKEFGPTMLRIAQKAAKLDESKKASLVIGVDTDQHQIYIKNHHNTTTAIYKRY